MKTKDIIDIIKKYEKCYDVFKKFLLKVIFKDDKERYKKTLKTNVYEFVFYVIRFLEYNDVPIDEAITFYSYKYDSNNFFKKVIHLIDREFYRLENNKKTNYIPF